MFIYWEGDFIVLSLRNITLFSFCIICEVCPIGLSFWFFFHSLQEQWLRKQRKIHIKCDFKYSWNTLVIFSNRSTLTFNAIGFVAKRIKDWIIPFDFKDLSTIPKWRSSMTIPCPLISWWNFICRCFTDFAKESSSIWSINC